MSWIHTQMKPVKECEENPVYPLSSIYQDINWVASGGTKHAALMACAMICAYDIKTVVEIGLMYGFTTQILSKALATNAMDDGLLVSCDICGNRAKRTYQLTKDLPIKHVRVEADSIKVRWSDYLEGRKIGLAFIDGDHTYENAIGDMLNCYDLLDDNGIMIVHDYSPNAHPYVFTAVNEFIARYNSPWFFLPENRISTDYRTAILQKRKFK